MHIEGGLLPRNDRNINTREIKQFRSLSNASHANTAAIGLESVLEVKLVASVVLIKRNLIK